jgi:hypothetical protein
MFMVAGWLGRSGGADDAIRLAWPAGRRSEMSGEAKAMQPEDVTRLVAERLNAGDAAGVAALYEPLAVLAYPADRPVAGREAIQAVYQHMVVRYRDPAAYRQVEGPSADLDPLGRRHWRPGAGPAPPARWLVAADHRPP